MFEFSKIKEAIANRKWMEGDLVVWMILITLCIISIVEVYSATSNMSFSNKFGGRYWKPVMEHGIYVTMGIFVAWVAHKIPCKYYKLINTFSLHCIAWPLLIWALISSQTINGTDRWVHIGSKTVQPSEFVKVTLIGFVAFVLATFHNKKGRATDGAMKFVAVETLVLCLAIGKDNLSTALLIFVVILAMLWFADANRKVLFTVVSVIILGGGLAWGIMMSLGEKQIQTISNTFGVERFATWAHRIQNGMQKPEDPNQFDVSKYQQEAHAKIAVANSNVIGRGPGKSVERDYLPMAYSDFIYAIIMEEGGIESGALVMFLYLLLLYRSWRIAQQCATRFPAYLVMGLSLMLVLQAMINMAVAVGAFPVTGQQLPLVSRGGTSTFVTCAYIGMILSVSRSAKKIKPAEELESVPATA